MSSPEHRELLLRIDPELRGALSVVPEGLFERIGNDPVSVRNLLNDLRPEGNSDFESQSVNITSTVIGVAPSDELRLVLYRPTSPGPHPAVLWFHGGGHVIGTAEEPEICIPLAETVNALVVSVDYPLAPEFTYEAHIDAARQAFQWLTSNADKLGVDKGRIAVGGASAGAGLAAGFSLYNRDTNGPPLAFQLLLYPMLDDTHDTPSGRAITFAKVWNRDVSLKSWAMYLGDAYGTSNVSPYAAPARATSLAGLPPAFITVGTEDLFRDEAIDYAQRLMEAGVATDLEVHAGMFHSGNRLAPQAAVSKRLIDGYTAALVRALDTPTDTLLATDATSIQR